MKNFIQKWVLHNLGYKILALVIAIILWLIYTNSNDPIHTYSVDVPVTVQNQDQFTRQGRYFEIEGTSNPSNLKVTVYLRARNSVIEKLRNRSASSYLSAYVDLYELDSSESDRLLIHYSITDPTVKAEFYQIRNKSYLSVEVEDNVTVEVPINYVISGEPAVGYLNMEEDPSVVVTPETVKLTGPANQISNISYGQVSVDITGANANVTKVGRIYLKDKDGNDVSYSRDVIVSSVSEASVFVPIYAFKSVPLSASVTGTPASGYQYANNAQISVDQIEVYGPESVMNKLRNITLPPVDLSEATGSLTQTYQLQDVLRDAFGQDNDGNDVVRLMPDAPTEATVDLSVEKIIERSFTIHNSSITVYNLTNDWELTFDQDTVTITVQGLTSQIRGLSISDINVSLTLAPSDLTKGSHTSKLVIGGIGDMTAKDVTISYTLRSKTDSGQPLPTSSQKESSASDSDSSTGKAGK